MVQFDYFGRNFQSETFMRSMEECMKRPKGFNQLPAVLNNKPKFGNKY